MTTQPMNSEGMSNVPAPSLALFAGADVNQAVNVLLAYGRCVVHISAKKAIKRIAYHELGFTVRVENNVLPKRGQCDLRWVYRKDRADLPRYQTVELRVKRWVKCAYLRQRIAEPTP